MTGTCNHFPGQTACDWCRPSQPLELNADQMAGNNVVRERKPGGPMTYRTVAGRLLCPHDQTHTESDFIGSRVYSFTVCDNCDRFLSAVPVPRDMT